MTWDDRIYRPAQPEGSARRVGRAAGNQRAIDWTPAARECASEWESKRMAIFELLRRGPARRSELKAVGGDRFSARVNELRSDGARIIGPVAAPRWGIHERTEPWPDGEDCYRLEGE